MSAPLIVAHRGDVETAPENTLAAFERAVERGADAVEFDVHLTADGGLVVHHDYTLGRTTDGRGLVGAHTLAALQRLDAGSWFHNTFAHERPPSLREVLMLGRGRVRFELELRAPTRRFLELVLQDVHEFGVLKGVEFTSPHLPLLAQLKVMQPDVRMGMFVQPFPDWLPTELAEQHVLGNLSLLEVQVAHLPASLLTESFTVQLQESGFLVHAANLSTEADLERAVRLGVDQFSTDRLSLALAVRASVRHE